MKKIIILILLAFSSLSVNAQLVEHFENPQRFQFTPFEHDFRAGYMLGYNNIYGWAWDDYRFSNDSIFFSKKCIRDSSHGLIYGIAVPLQLDNYYSHNYDTVEYLNKVLTYYDTSKSSAFIGGTTNRTGYDFGLLSRASTRIGESALIGNYFKMPDQDSSYFTGTRYGLCFQVLEVYFDQPVSVEDNFVIGLNLCHSFSVGEMVGPLSVFKNGFNNNMSFPGSDTTFYSKIVDSSFIKVTRVEGSPHTFFYCTWAAPFPIVTPPPCMPPIWLKVTEQHRQGATIQWRAQYANTAFEVEYGPRGFAEGTGTTVGPVAPDAQYNGQVTLNGLTMGADYTVRVRSYCNVTGGYSDWTELDFHADAFYNVNTSTNNDSWGYVTGGGEYLAGTTARLFAYPRSEYCPFLNWSDGSNQNPRILTVTRDTSFLAIFGCDSVGINTVDGLAAVTVTPNPASAEVVVRSSQPIATCTLFDIQGRAIATVAPAATTAVIDLRDLRPALYILAVSTDSGTVIKKIVKN